MDALITAVSKAFGEALERRSEPRNKHPARHSDRAGCFPALGMDE
jgi:hypothetical protein